jgi:outer membrane protein insertion porin family
MLSLSLVLSVAVMVSPAREFTQIQITGNRSFAARQLQSVAGLKSAALLSEGQVQRGVAAITEFYRQHGFLSATADWDTASGRSIKPGQPLKRTLRITIQEGPRTRIRTVRVVSGDTIPIRSGTAPDSILDKRRGAAVPHSAGHVPWFELRERLAVRRGEFLNSSYLADSKTNLVELYRNNGFFFVQCTVIVRPVSDSSRVSPPAGETRPSADVVFSIQEGPVCYIRRISVRGNVRFKRALIDRFLAIRPGERYAQEALIKAQRRLYATRLFDRIHLIAVPSDTASTPMAAVMARVSDSVDLRLDLAELAPRSVGVGAGIRLLPWRGLISAEWEHLNVLEQGHDFRIGVEYSPAIGPEFLQDYLFSLNLFYRIPYVTRWEINLTTRPFARWEHESARYELEYGAETGMNHDFTASLSAALFNRLRRIIYSDTSTLANRDQPIQAITNSLNALLILDTRNDVFNPVRGAYLRPGAEIAGGLLGGDNHFYRFTVEGQYFQRFLLRHVLALHAVAGAVFPYNGSSQVPYYEEFSLGGANSLRGYDEKSIGPVVVAADSHHYGDIMINTNVELRTPFVTVRTAAVKGLGGVLFLDGGTVFGSGQDHSLYPYQFAAGAGIRIITPIGPVRLDYGKRLTDPPQHDWGRIYVGILNLF